MPNSINIVKEWFSQEGNLISSFQETDQHKFVIEQNGKKSLVFIKDINSPINSAQVQSFNRLIQSNKEFDKAYLISKMVLQERFIGI